MFRTRGLEPADPDEAGVWSVPCVLIRAGHRGAGLADRLLTAAVDHARRHGAAILEGYPVADKDQGRRSGLSSGTVGLFTRAGFALHHRPGTGRRVVMRVAV